MKKLVRNLIVVAMLGCMSSAAFGQHKEQDKRPPKEPSKVVVPDKREKPPSNSNQSRPKDDKRGKP